MSDMNLRHCGRVQTAAAYTASLLLATTALKLQPPFFCRMHGLEAGQRYEPRHHYLLFAWPHCAVGCFSFGRMHELEVGQRYELVVTNPPGLWRYRMGDVLRCVGFYGQAAKVTTICGADPLQRKRCCCAA